MGRLRAWGGLLAPPTSPQLLEEPQRSWAGSWPPSPWLPVWLPESRLAVSAAELGTGWAAGRENTCLAGELRGGGGVGGDFKSFGASTCGHLDAQILTWRPLRGQLVQPAASILGQAAEVSNIVTQAQHSPCGQAFSLACVV